MVLWEWLLIEYIQRGVAQPSSLQGGNHGNLIHQGAARGVYEDRAAFERAFRRRENPACHR